MTAIKITPFNNRKHCDQVISLWNDVFGYEAAHNLSRIVINKKLEFGDGLFFVAIHQKVVVGTIMAGYDGHRGWIYSIAVGPENRHQSIESLMLSFAERKLMALGCMKINLQIMDGNEAVENFYLTNGYLTEKRISMGKSLPENINNPQK